MGPAYFVIAIMGCADGGAACTPVATLPTRYESQAECARATTPALEVNNDFDFPTMTAQCQATSPRPAAQRRVTSARDGARG